MAAPGHLSFIFITTAHPKWDLPGAERYGIVRTTAIQIGLDRLRSGLGDTFRVSSIAENYKLPGNLYSAGTLIAAYGDWSNDRQAAEKIGALFKRDPGHEFPRMKQVEDSGWIVLEMM